ncbi:MAG: hypothetical protein U0822_11445 [Anaerolineae bacterium]
MSEHLLHWLEMVRHRWHAVRTWIAARVTRVQHRLHRRTLPVVVLIADKVQRCALERQLGAGLRQLEQVVRMPRDADVAVIVQHTLMTDHQLAGCYQVGQRDDGQPFALIRIALQVNGRVLSTDELLAVMAEQWIGLTTQQGGGLSVIVPIDLDPASTKATSQVVARDPLTPAINGHQSAALASAAR